MSQAHLVGAEHGLPGLLAPSRGTLTSDVDVQLEPVARRSADASGTRMLRDASLREPSVDGTAALESTHTGAVSLWEGRQQPRRAPFSAWSGRYLGWMIGLDAVVGVLAVSIASAIPLLSGASLSPAFAAMAAVVWPAAVAISRGYVRSFVGIGSDELRAIFRGALLAIAVAAVPSTLGGSVQLVALGVVAAPIAAGASVMVRFAGRKWLHARQRSGRCLRRVVVVGSPYAAAELQAMLDRDPLSGMKVIGACVPGNVGLHARDSGMNVLGSLEDVPQIVRTLDADAVAVAGGDATRQNYLRELSWALEGAGVELLVHPGLVEVAGPRMHIRPHVGLPLLHVEQPHFTGWRRFVKRFADLALTGIGVAMISPILAGIALAIKLHDGGPVIFRQTRVGLDGTTFTMLKFRSMHIDAEQRLAELRAKNPELGLMFKMENDPRITGIGKILRKFSLDELPQLFNVLTGQMSLVGPRPPLQSEVDNYENHARRRLLVTPGLTGLWQVSGRSLLSWEETVRLDLRYVENWSLSLDLLIIWKTFFAVVARRGAY